MRRRRLPMQRMAYRLYRETVQSRWPSDAPVRGLHQVTCRLARKVSSRPNEGNAVLQPCALGLAQRQLYRRVASQQHGIAKR